MRKYLTIFMLLSVAFSTPVFADDMTGDPAHSAGMDATKSDYEGTPRNNPDAVGTTSSMRSSAAADIDADRDTPNSRRRWYNPFSWFRGGSDTTTDGSSATSY